VESKLHITRMSLKRKWEEVGEHIVSAAVGDMVSRAIATVVDKVERRAEADGEVDRLDRLVTMVSSARGRCGGGRAHPQLVAAPLALEAPRRRVRGRGRDALAQAEARGRGGGGETRPRPRRRRALVEMGRLRGAAAVQVRQQRVVSGWPNQSRSKPNFGHYRSGHSWWLP